MAFPSRIHLGKDYYPTPIEKLPRLSRHLEGPELFIKRDDQTGFGGGGNKVRKLEFLLSEALERRCDYLITMGGPQSNHCRQTAAAAAALGMGCCVVLRGHPPEQKLGNLLLMELTGTQIVWAGDRPREEVAAELMNTFETAGKKPYLVPLGGSTPRGAIGYVVAMQELMNQLHDLNLTIDSIVVASSSAGTQAGLVLGAHYFNFQGRILGISIDHEEEELKATVKSIAVGAAAYLTFSDSSFRQFAPEKLRIEVNADYLGGGYAVVGEREADAIRTMARMQGLFLDPVYTGRAMAGLIDLIRKGVFNMGERVLFWHTGGASAMSAFSEALKSR